MKFMDLPILRPWRAQGLHDFPKRRRVASGKR